MAVPDAVDARLLTLVAEVGRVAVHDLARRAGLDVREVAARLAGLAASGLPLVVGVECDPTALRYALHQQSRWVPPNGPQHGPQPGPSHGSPNGPQNGPQNGAAWDEPVTVRTTPARWRSGAVGDTLPAEGPGGEPLAVRLVEVVDPADFLFTAAGHRLQPGERSVVVHAEVTNRGTAPLPVPPDACLVLVDGAGQPVSKAPLQLSSRPPHRPGVRPGETAGGHTVYVLPEATELAAVRWTPRPGDERRAVNWRL